MQANDTKFGALTDALPAPYKSVGFALRRLVKISALVLALIFCWWAAGVRPSLLFEPGTIASVWGFLRSLFPPDFSIAFVRITVAAIGQTVAIAVVSTVLSIIIGLPLGILSAATLWRRGVLNENKSATHLMPVVSRLSRALLGFLRAVPDLVWALLFVVAVGLGSLAGALGLAIGYGGVIGRVYADVFDDVDQRPVEALYASGATRGQIFLRAIWPQALPSVTAYTLYSFECSVRAASVLGFVGAGGIGYEINLSMRLFDYGQVLTLILAFVVLLSANDIFSRFLRRRFSSGSARPSQVRRLMESALSRAAEWSPNERARSFRGTAAPMIPITMVIVILVSFYAIGFGDGRPLDVRIAERTIRFLAAMFPPELDPAFLSTLLKPVFQTIGISVIGTLVGVGIGASVAPLATSSLMLVPSDAVGRHSLLHRGVRSLIYYAARLMFTLLRSIPELVWVLICILAVGLGPFAGTLAIGLHTGGVLGKLYAEILEEVPSQPIEALRANGSSTLQILLWGMWPYARPMLTSYTVLRWETNLRVSTILGLVGGGGLGQIIYADVQLGFYSRLATLIMVIYVLVLATDWISDKLRLGRVVTQA
jgi:phosphonate transport system permease protein